MRLSIGVAFQLLLLVGALVVPGPSASAEPPRIFQQAVVSPTDNNGWVGWSVALSGDTLALGTEFAADDGEAVYLFERDPESGAWEERARLEGDRPDDFEHFGTAIDLEGDTLVVGSAGDDDVGPIAGAVYVFERNAWGPGAWGRTAKILPTSDFNFFGSAVSLVGDTLAIGAYWQSEPSEGSVWLYRRASTGEWLPVATFAEEADGYAEALAFDGDHLLVGARLEDGYAGSAFLYARRDGDWRRLSRLAPPSVEEDDRFGESVAVAGTTAVVGAPNHDDAAPDAGVAYVFEIEPELASDDFDDGVPPVGWRPVLGSWTEAGGSYNGVADGGLALALAEGLPACGVCSIHARLELVPTLPSSAGAAVLLAGWVSASHTAVTAILSSGGEVELVQIEDGFVVQRDAAVQALRPGESHEIELANDGIDLWLLVDGATVLQVPNRLDDELSGVAGVGARAAGVRLHEIELRDAVRQEAELTTSAAAEDDALGFLVAIDGDRIVARSEPREWLGVVFERQVDGSWAERSWLAADAPMVAGRYRAEGLAVEGDTALVGDFLTGPYNEQIAPGVGYLFDLAEAATPQPALAIGGSCDRETAVDVSNALPDGAVEVWKGGARGVTTVETGPCSGARIDLAEAELAAVVPVDGDGRGTLALGPPEVCGWTLQALDETTCRAGLLAAPTLAESVVIDFGAAFVVLDGDSAVLTDPVAGFDLNGLSQIHERDEGGPGAWGWVESWGACGPDNFCGVDDLEGDRLTFSWGESFRVLEIHERLDDEWSLAYEVSDASSGLLSGDTVAARPSTRSPTVILFDRDDAGNWAESRRIESVAPSRALQGDVLVAGDPGDGDAGEGAGAVRRFERNAGGVGNWGEVEKLVPPEVATGDAFGESVALDGELIAAGAPWDDDAGPQGGVVYVFHESAGDARLVATETGVIDRLGEQVRVSGDRLLALGAGAATLFELDAESGAWREVAKLAPSDGAALTWIDLDGLTALATSGNRIGIAGKSYVFELAGVVGEGAAQIETTAQVSHPGPQRLTEAVPPTTFHGFDGVEEERLGLP